MTFSTATGQGYGVVTEQGIVNLSQRHGQQWPSLREVIAAGALPLLAEEATTLTADLPLTSVTLEIPIPAPEKIICVGVNYPSRNEEYKDGQDAPANPSLFIRFPRSFTGHATAATAARK